MRLPDLYQQTPVARHAEIVVAGDRVFFDGEEYLLQPDGNLRLVRSQKGVEQKLEQIAAKLGIR